MEQQLLKEESVYPTEEVLEKGLGKVYKTYAAFTKLLASLEINQIWRYYNDGKAWLCKCEHKKKTVLWLSVWNGFFKVSMYFTEKTAAGLPETAKQAIAKPVGKLLPVIYNIKNEAQLKPLSEVMIYKRSLK